MKNVGILILKSSLIAILTAFLIPHAQAQIGTASNSLSLSGFYGEPIKSVAYGNNQFIFLYHQGNNSVFALATVGSFSVPQAQIVRGKVCDFDVLDTVIAFCIPSTISNGIVSYGSVNNFFSGGSYNTEFLQSQLMKKVKLYKVSNQYCLSVITQDHYVFDCKNIPLTTSSSFVCSVNVAKLPGDIHDVAVTANFVCFVGTGNSVYDQNSIYLYRYDKALPNPIIEQIKVTTSGPIIFYDSELEGAVYTSITYKALITELLPGSDIVLTGTHILKNQKANEEYHTIDLMSMSIYKVEDVVHTINDRPELYDLEYDKYNDKVIALTYSLDYDRDIIYEIDPNIQSTNVRAIIPDYGPMPSNSAVSHKYFLKSVAVYNENYYMVLGKHTLLGGYIFDKNKSIYESNNCYSVAHLQTQLVQGTITPLEQHHFTSLQLSTHVEFVATSAIQLETICQ